MTMNYKLGKFTLIKLNESYTRLCENGVALHGRGFSYLADHSLTSGYIIDWDNIIILSMDNLDLHLLYK